MKNISIEEFAEISHFTSEETAALQENLNDPQLRNKAEIIAEKCFIPGVNTPLPEFEENRELSQCWFAAAYLGCSASREHYRHYGFPESVWRETLTDLSVWLRNCKRNNGFIGLAYARPWTVQLYAGMVTRHGRLECNSEYFFHYGKLVDADNKVILDYNDPVINLHIPEDGPMSMKDCGISIRRMAEFFAKYRSNFDYKGFICSSWLLDSQLADMLPESSNILKFQKLGFRFLLNEPADSVFRIFGTSNPEDIEKPTYLQRTASEFLKSGGEFRTEGFFIPRDDIEAAGYDLNVLIEHYQYIKYAKVISS